MRSKTYFFTVIFGVTALVLTSQPQKGSLVDMALALAGGSAGPGDSGDGSAGSNNSGTSSGSGGPSGHESNGSGSMGPTGGGPTDLFGGVGGIRGPTGEIHVTELSGPQTTFNDGWSGGKHTPDAPRSRPDFNSLGRADKLSSSEIGTSIRSDAPTYSAGSFTDLSNSQTAKARRDYSDIMSELDGGLTNDQLDASGRVGARGDTGAPPHDDNLTYDAGSRNDIQNTRSAEFERATAGLKGVDREQQQANARSAARGPASAAGPTFSGGAGGHPNH